ncbi:acyl-CoA dehydrogenase family protein [Heyndrickxia coagulans]|uniref:Acyl-CoA dehydrogenase n=1 Tax=Heyndrickxia coagulans TaxID=1398 RepID=A0A150K2X1_HEYCO|nr:acyl-CoA dehydrogenase family protein [Heyndrickxia coagulans]KYC63847.1 Acyl-CoA dehydrogenase [Heyndrickxia coagulans]
MSNLEFLLIQQALKYNQLPLIFWGIDNGFLDGIVDELKAHYRVIEANNKNVRRDVAFFLTHTKEVKTTMEKIDTEIGEAMQTGPGNARVAATVSVPPAEKINCAASPYLKSGMAIRRNQLNKSFQKFAGRFTAFMEPLIAATLNEAYKMETAGQAIHFAHEAIEMHGGNGYIEDFVTPRLLRDAQVLTVWEGTANILGLEVLRLMRKFKVHDIFIGMMREKINQLQAGTWLSAGLEQLEETCRFVMEAKEESVQTYHCKKVARQMAKIYESVTALEDALAGQRQKWIAEAYLRLAWHDPLAIDPEMAFVKHFEEVVMEKVPANEGN